jgi:outer membrane protein assembly factor BamE (lipoprotein component of BamABCDE complex)
MMRHVGVVAIGGVMVMALTACGMNAQTVGPQSEIGEKHLTVGTVQREIHKGMAASDVAEALGAPNIVTTDDQGREVWLYDRMSTERAHEMGYAGLILFGYSRDAGVASQRTLTVIVKFDADKRVREYAYHAARF